MATAIYHGFLTLSLATMLSNGQDGKITPSSFVLGWTLGFDVCLLLTLGSFMVG